MRGNMRILHIAETLEGASGVATFVRELDAALRAKGVESSVAVDGRCSGRVDVLHLHGLWLKMYHQASKWASETLGQTFRLTCHFGIACASRRRLWATCAMRLGRSALASAPDMSPKATGRV